MANDIITMLDDKAVKGMTLNQAVDKIRGPVKTKIKLTIMRKGSAKPVVLSITRDVIRVKSVRWHPEGVDVGYIRITRFNEQTTDKLKQALADLKNKLGGDKIKGYILDLRRIRAACSTRRSRFRTHSSTTVKSSPRGAAPLTRRSASTLGQAASSPAKSR